MEAQNGYSEGGRPPWDAEDALGLSPNPDRARATALPSFRSRESRPGDVGGRPADMRANSPVLDRFIPRPDVRERFETTVRAPAGLVMDVACSFDMQSLPIVKAIFWLREKVMRSGSAARRRPQGILEETKSLGWGLLAEPSDGLVICGARCQPWTANVTFSAIVPDEFEAYAGPDEVKIAWTLEANALGETVTRLAHETRAVATDESARGKFLRYWRWARFGIVPIRLLLLPAVRREAEGRWRLQRRSMRDSV